METVVVSRKRKKQKQFVVVKPWPTDEVSTRNCYHCLAPKEGMYVRCRKGCPMAVDYDRHQHLFTYNGVIKSPRLVAPCHDCQDFDNNWE